MFCKKCNNPLPSEGYICKFCGALMTQEQIATQKENMKNNIGKGNPNYLSKKFGRTKEVEYNTYKDNKSVMGAAMLIIFVFLIVLSIIIFFIKR